MTLRLELREAPEARVDAAALRPDALAGLTRDEIAALPLRHGRHAATVGELFSVSGDGETDVEVIGDLSRVDRLGEAMASGRLVIEGSAGDHVAARASGGEVVVRGDAGAYAGAELRGGCLTVHGRAGVGLASAYPGARVGMAGGEVIVHGDAGEDAVAGLRRGLVAVGGDVGPGAGLRMLAGTLIALGSVGAQAGLGLRRGTLVAAGGAPVPPTFAFATRYRPPALRLQLVLLRRRGLPVGDELLDRIWARYSGDRLELTRGELLIPERRAPR